MVDKVYKGVRIDGNPVVFVNNKVLDPHPSAKLINYSVDRFDWGNEGAGAGQLAIAILYDYTQDRRKVVEFHQDFKWCFLVHADHDEFQVNASEIDEFLKERKA